MVGEEATPALMVVRFPKRIRRPPRGAFVKAMQREMEDMVWDIGNDRFVLENAIRDLRVPLARMEKILARLPW